jgi:hypothetical protein
MRGCPPARKLPAKSESQTTMTRSIRHLHTFAVWLLLALTKRYSLANDWGHYPS